MGRIQASTGINTGIDIQGTVQKLMQIEAAPRDALTARQKDIQTQQAAVTDLTAVSVAVQLAVERLKKPDLFSGTSVTSSDPSVLTATTSTSVAPGQYQFVPARLAQANQALSTGVASSTQALGGGQLAFRFGGQVDSAVSLSELNGGSSVSRGQIKITDRAGASATVDLRYVQTIDDVVAAVNSTSGISVSATTDGDHLVLHDQSGGTGALRVQEVGGGTTAASLGLGGINASSDTVAGQNVVSLFRGLRLDQLRDGSGLSLRPALAELSVALHDGSSRQIDLDPVGQTAPTTLGDVLDRINAAAPGKLEAKISADGQHIELNDLTSGGGTFAVTAPTGSTVTAELGLTGAPVGNTISSSRLLSGLKTTLISSLAGGQGLGSLGAINLTDRSGATASVNLAGAETLDDVIGRINAAGLGITASYNAARNGLELTDTTGSTASNLIVADGDANNSATKLGLAKSVAGTTIDSGNLQRQNVSRSTLLASYNGGQGVSGGTFTITTSKGEVATLNLAILKPATVGDLIDSINSKSLGVQAQINAAGDGIELIDTAGGSGSLTVADQGGSHAAADLHLVGSGISQTVNGQPAQVLDGSTTYKVTLAAGDTLSDVVSRINALGAGVNASVLDAGGGSLPAHLSLAGAVTGRAGELHIDGSSLGLSFSDLTTAQDALLQVGNSASAGTLIASNKNSFNSVVPGLNLTLAGASTDPVTVTAAQSSDSIASAVQLFIDQYNKLRDKLSTYTSFDSTTNTTGTLFGTGEALQLDSSLARAITGTYFGSSSIRSLAELGVSVDQDGKLAFDKSQFQAKFSADPQGVTQFFTADKQGFAVQTDTLLESLVGKDNSLLVNRIDSLQRQVDDYTSRINDWNTRLDNIQQRMLTQYYMMDTLVGSIKNNLSYINQIQYVAPVVSTKSG
jgi:flagellar hook-associated protein 2